MTNRKYKCAICAKVSMEKTSPYSWVQMLDSTASAEKENSKLVVYCGFSLQKPHLPSTKPTRKSLSLCSEWYSRRWTFPYARNRETAFSGLQQCGMYLTNSFTCTQSHDNQLHLQSHYISTTGPKHYNARAL